jgi:hypothetical protein
MCPYYLDGDLTVPNGRQRSARDAKNPTLKSVELGDTRRRHRTYRFGDGMWPVQFSRAAGRRRAGLARRSLKTQQHDPSAGRYAPLLRPRSGRRSSRPERDVMAGPP